MPVITQLTYDHTKAYDAYLSGKLTTEQYHTHPDRLSLTSGLGIFTDPQIQTMTNKIKNGDIIVMTTDGIHYAIKENAIRDIVLRSENTSGAAQSLILAAREMKYEDNMSAMVLYSIPDE
jgi:serine/threonine protein phosphatase PrpC